MASKLTDFRQGDTKFVRIEYGDGVDITGYFHALTLRADFDDATPIAAQVKSTVGDHALDEALNGVAVLELDSTLSATLTPGAYVYDVQRVRPNGANPLDVLTLDPTVDDIGNPVQVLFQVTKITTP